MAEGSEGSGPGSTDVQVTCYADTPPRRSQQPRRPRRAQQAQQAHQEHFDPGQLVPLLTPPAGARQRMDGSGGDFDDWRSSARLATELDLATIAAHYARQLEYAGWTRRGGEERGGGVIAWSAWSFTQVGTSSSSNPISLLCNSNACSKSACYSLDSLSPLLLA